MTRETNDTAPDLIVLGPDDEGKPRAARFPADQANLVAKAAKAMNLTVCKADSAALADLTKKLPTGRLYATGRAFVSPVGRNLYGKIVEQLRTRRSASTRHSRPGVRRPRYTEPASDLGRHCRRSPGDRPGKCHCRLVGGDCARPGR